MTAVSPGSHLQAAAPGWPPAKPSMTCSGTCAGSDAAASLPSHLPGFVLASAARASAGSRGQAFVRHALIFGLANLLALASNGVLTFLLPRWLSLEGYGLYRLFLLYGGFAGALHLGLLDGALIRWAAAPRRRLPRELRPSLSFLLITHLLLLAPAMAVLWFCFRQQWWFFVAAATLAYAVIWNPAILGQFALQADKSFGLLSAATVLPPALLLAAVAAAHQQHRLTLPTVFGSCLGGWLVADVVAWIGLLHNYRPKKHLSRERSGRRLWRTGTCNVGAGWSVLLAGFVTSLAFALDRVVVSLSFPLGDFAIYSLAATAMALVNAMTLSLSRVVFPYLSDGMNAGERRRAYGWGECCLLTLWAIALGGYFPLRLLILRWLPAYVASLPVLRPLLLATGFTAAIYVLHANYFRIHRRQRTLLLASSTGLAAAAVLLVLARRSGSLTAMAWAMLAAIALWWLVDEWLLARLTGRGAREILRSLAFVAASAGCFLIGTSAFSHGSGLAVYGVTAGCLIALAWGRTLRSLPRLPARAFLNFGFRRTE